MEIVAEPLADSYPERDAVKVKDFSGILLNLATPLEFVVLL